MKTLTTLIVTITLSLVAIPQAFAATTTKVYNSGILVLAFLGVCALIVVVQMIPAIITLSGIVKELLAGKSKGEEAKAEISN